MRTGETAKVSAEENRSITRKLQLPTKKHKRLPLAQNRRAWAVSRLSPRAVPHARRTRQRPRRRPHHRHSSGAVAAARTHPGPRSGNQHAGRALRKPLHEISGRLSRPKADRLSERELRSLASPAPRDFCSGDAKAPERHGNSGRARDAAIGGGSKPPMLAAAVQRPRHPRGYGCTAGAIQLRPGNPKAVLSNEVQQHAAASGHRRTSCAPRTMQRHGKAFRGATATRVSSKNGQAVASDRSHDATRATHRISSAQGARRHHPSRHGARFATNNSTPRLRRDARFAPRSIAAGPHVTPLNALVFARRSGASTSVHTRTRETQP